jgi:hypothetical protein
MTVYIKSGGAWRAGNNGQIKIRWGGAWQTASYIYEKVNGAWQDSGYRGFPLAPQSIWVHAWDFNNVAIGFTGPPAGGAPVAYYRLVQTDANGNWLNSVNVGGSPWGNFGVGQDGRYQFFVQSVSAAGLESGWCGPVRVQIGHTELGHYGTVQQSRPWSSEHISSARNRDDPFWVGVPGSVILTGLHWRNMTTPQSSVVTPYNQRTVNLITQTVDRGPLNDHIGHTILSGSSYAWWDFPLYEWGNGQACGFVARGSGWSTTGNGTYMLWCEDMWCDGTEYYDVSVYYVDRNYAGNSYW